MKIHNIMRFACIIFQLHHFCSCLLFHMFVGVWCAAESRLCYSVRPQRGKKRKGDRGSWERGKNILKHVIVVLFGVRFLGFFFLSAPCFFSLFYLVNSLSLTSAFLCHSSYIQQCTVRLILSKLTHSLLPLIGLEKFHCARITTDHHCFTMPLSPV